MLLNPFSGTSIWSFKGAQGGIIGSAEPLGRFYKYYKHFCILFNCKIFIGRTAKHLLITIADKPIIYATALNTKSGSFTSRSILAGVVRCLVSHPTGHFVFAAIDNKIYTWMVYFFYNLTKILACDSVICITKNILCYITQKFYSININYFLVFKW